MYKIIASDQREYGPVSVEQLRQWVAEKRINAQTLVQPETGGDWKPLSSYPELAGILAAPPTLPVADFQPPAAGADALAAEILARDVPINIGACISRSWALVKANFWMAVGGTFLVVLTMAVVQWIPMIGGIAGMVLNGVLSGGLYWFFIKMIRGEPADIGDAFAGFSRGFVQLMLAGIVMGLLSAIVIMIVAIPFLLPFLIAAFKMLMAAAGDPTRINWNSLMNSLGVLGGIGILVCCLMGIFVSIIWLFTFPLVIDKQLNFWEAMELSRKAAMKRVFGLFGLLIVSGLVVLGGVLLCCVGIFVTIPIALGAITYAYEDIFGAQASQTT
ncbi:MAG: DUF4339 domain-containing protein [Verrucomicrobia bacterium]|nr:DUF4339 domain-containing protein [Verrucomicrobiota bacterium]